MATPLDLEDFALGFGLTEGLLARAQELYTVQPQKVAHGIELHLEVAAACEWRLKERRRTLAGRTGCGLCGSVSLDQVRQDLKPVKGESFDVQSVLKAQAQLQQWHRGLCALPAERVLKWSKKHWFLAHPCCRRSPHPRRLRLNWPAPITWRSQALCETTSWWPTVKRVVSRCLPRWSHTLQKRA